MRIDSEQLPQHLKRGLKPLYSVYGEETLLALEAADRIRASGADILFVGIGVPRQENFIDEQWDRLGIGMAIGVGGSFDVMAGLRLRAPVWMQKSGLEWIFRAIQEPRRLFPRYLVTNSKMIWLVLRELLKTKRAN